MSAADKTKLDGIEAGAQAVTAAHVQTATAALASAMSVNSQKITNLATPTTGTDAATKAYADSVGGAGAAVMLTAYQPGPVGTFPQDAQFHNQTVGTGWIDPNTGTWSQGEFPSASYFSGGLVAQMVPSGSGGFTLDRMFCSVLTPPAGGETLTIKAKYSTDYGSTWTTSLTATIAAGAHAGNSGATVSSTIPQGAIVSFEVSNNTGTQVAADLVVGVRANLL
jgi:hypothetical protein